jgi:hypothetical protein
MKSSIAVLGLCFVSVLPAMAQTQETKFIADTIVIQAEGKYEADPDLATITFSISTQDKELKNAYAKASQSIQRIVQVATQNGLTKEEISTGALTVVPYYEGDRNKRRVRSYRVESQVTLRVKEFSRVGPLIDDSVQEGIVDFRSLTYSLADEEAAKEHAVSDAIQHAVGRAKSALRQTNQGLGALRYSNVDVRNAVGIAQLTNMNGDLLPFARRDQMMAVDSASPPPPMSQQQKITVTATVQCVFQIK